jgi:hypothetical protein
MRRKVVVRDETEPMRDESGMVLPRFCTPTPATVTGSHGPAFVAWCSERLGIVLRPWQVFVSVRLLEHDADGRLVWDEAVVTLARQQGKSVWLRCLALWRCEHPHLFGDGTPQVLLHTAQRRTTGREVWVAGARLAEARLGAQVRMANGQEEATFGNGSRWVLHAANENAGVGFTLDGAAVDEAWNVRRPVVDDAIAPTMVEREDAQLLLVSTAGDSSSDLLQSRRDAGLEAIHNADDSTRILLIEWSIPESIPLTDPAGWPWASPHWHPRRERFLSEQIGKVPAEAFARQYANRWVVAVDGWVDAGVWEQGCQPTVVEPDRAPDVAAVEVSMVGHQHAVVLAWQEPVTGATIVRLRTLRTAQDVDDLLGSLRPVATLTSPFYEGRLTWPTTTVARTELTTGTPVVHDLLNRNLVLHDGDPLLTRQMLQARASRTDTGWVVSATRSSGPVHAVRAMVWAVSRATRVAQGRPRFVAR